MCDDITVQEDNEYLKNAATKEAGNLTRRQFGKVAVGASVMMALPAIADAKAVQESEIVVKTPDGEADCYFVHPTEGKHPAVIVWPDIIGLRPAFKAMGKRLAESGYAVLVVNPFYRAKKAPVVAEGASFQDPDTRSTLIGFARQLNATTHMTDAKAFVEFLDGQSPVDTKRKIGTTGYCMGGPIVLRTAAAVPTRIGAGATFHGGGLVTEADDSPHKLIPEMKADFLIAIAENDDERDSESKNVLKADFAKAGLAAEIEVYEGAMHGWCPPDSRVYNEAQAEKAWRRLLALFEKALA
ncbi:MAG: dienelactone hydrolase family protein [Cellvibrionaceae bacterium]